MARCRHCSHAGTARRNRARCHRWSTFFGPDRRSEFRNDRPRARERTTACPSDPPTGRANSAQCVARGEILLWRHFYLGINLPSPRSHLKDDSQQSSATVMCFPSVGTSTSNRFPAESLCSRNREEWFHRAAGWLARVVRSQVEKQRSRSHRVEPVPRC